MLLKIIDFLNYAILAYFIMSMIIYTILLFSSFPALINFFKRSKMPIMRNLLIYKNLPPVTVIMPCYNEEEFILDSVQSVLHSKYKNLFLIVINDGSTDQTMQKLTAQYDLESVPIIIQNKIPTTPVKQVFISKTHVNLMVIDKEHTPHVGGGDSINIGINACFTPYFICCDSDSLMDKNAVDEFMFEFLIHPNTIAVGGAVYILNSCEYKDGIVTEARMPRRLVPAIQTLEYLRSHLFTRTGWNLYGGTMCYSGTATMLDRKVVLEAGGMDDANFAQDNEIIIRLHELMHKKKKKYTICFNPAAFIWTDVPHDLNEFRVQRNHWRRGMLRSTLKYMHMFFNPAYKMQGLFGFPFFMLLEIFAPFVEFTAYVLVVITYFMGILDAYNAFLYVIMAWGFTSYLTVANMFIGLVTFNKYQNINDIFYMFGLAIFEMFGFRQYLVVVNILATFEYIFRRLKGEPV